MYAGSIVYVCTNPVCANFLRDSKGSWACPPSVGGEYTLNNDMETVMKLDLTQIMNKRKESLDFEYELSGGENDEFALLPAGEAFDGPVRVRAHAFDANSYIRVDITAECTLICHCTRCLDEVRVPISVSFRRYAGQSVEYDDDGGEEDVLAVNDSAVCADADIMEEISLAAPEIVLCDEECPGLCPQCGKKLGAGCVCEKEEKKASDPRLDVFKRLLEQMENEE